MLRKVCIIPCRTEQGVFKLFEQLRHLRVIQYDSYSVDVHATARLGEILCLIALNWCSSRIRVVLSAMAKGVAPTIAYTPFSLHLTTLFAPIREDSSTQLPCLLICFCMLFSATT